MIGIRKRTAIFFFCALGAAALVFGGFFLFSSRYRDRVLPGLFAGDTPIGGLHRSSLVELLRKKAAILDDAGIEVIFTSRDHIGSFTMYPTIVTEDTTQELLAIDIDRAAQSFMNYGKTGHAWSQLFAPVVTIMVRPHLPIEDGDIVRDDEKLRELIAERVDAYERIPKEARVAVKHVDPLIYEVTDATEGIVYEYDVAIAGAVAAWRSLRIPHIRLEPITVTPKIGSADIDRIIHRLPAVFAPGELTLVHTDEGSRRKNEWRISMQNMADWIVPVRLKDSELSFGLDPKAVEQYIASVVAPRIEVQSRDAKFRVNDEGKVVEFQGSRIGVSVDVELTIAALQEVMANRVRRDDGGESDIPIALTSIQPHVTNDQANNLGITDILGAGKSNFSGSPRNRVKNIRHSVEKLHGVLVKPGEVFSTLAQIGPFGEDDGYVPELVIKGDELTPEIGGGLCQIGTTLFRMAMNAGMPITARRNHSLVVQYYGDPRNGKPGTDATIYDPAPDFRFKNDTGRHVLVQTDMNEKTGDLTFTLWGTSDGRTASYTAPIVSKWIPHGEPKTIETTKLPPGEKKCQKAFNGAEASFAYTRALSDGTVEKRVFESSYRPLPEICLLGVATPSSSSTINIPIGSLSG